MSENRTAQFIGFGVAAQAFPDGLLAVLQPAAADGHCVYLGLDEQLDGRGL